MIKKRKILLNILENLCLIMIVLVIIQTFTEDISIYLNFPPYLIKIIFASAFIFDLFFTIEFFVRFFYAIKKKQGVHYFFYRNGWIDLIASIPLLIFISIPEMIYFISDKTGINIIEYFKFILPLNLSSISIIDIDMLGMIKIIKAIRVARILRLLRVLKIFGKIKNVDSSSAQKHVSVISTIVINTIIIFLISQTILTRLEILPSDLKKIKYYENCTNEFYKNAYSKTSDSNFKKILIETAGTYKSLYRIEYKNKIIFESEISKNSNFQYLLERNEDFFIAYNVIPEKLSITYHREDYIKNKAFNNIINFAIILFVLFSIIIFYTGYFALTVSDPIYVMRNGFEKKEYTLAVKIRKHFKDDDVFLLAKDYNQRWLPAKLRKLSELQESQSKISLKDVFNSPENEKR